MLKGSGPSTKACKVSTMSQSYDCGCRWHAYLRLISTGRLEFTVPGDPESLETCKDSIRLGTYVTSGMGVGLVKSVRPKKP